VSQSQAMALPRVTYTNLHEDFSGVHAHLDALIPTVESTRLGGAHSGRIGAGDKIDGSRYPAFSPIDSRLLLGEFVAASPGAVEKAVGAARAAYPAWKGLGWARRIEILRAGADELARQKYEVSVACLIEVGKSRLEAVGEVEEAIDLIRYYCAEMEANNGFALPRPQAVANETVRSVLRPYGVFGVIAPFNFPVALSLAMICAALIAGNTVVFKPGEMSGLTGTMLAECLYAGGLPDGVLNLLFGGRQTGEALVRCPGVDGFAFTGSNAVGMDIVRFAASARANRPVLAEMGGKNPTFVTAAADLDVATAGVARSAFGLQGQKCSAGSKVYVQTSVLEDFVERLLATTRNLVIGDPRRSEVFMGPVVSAAALERFTTASADAARDGRVLHGGARLSGGVYEQGAYVEPTIVSGLAAEHRINREELFLPFLSVLPFDDLALAIADANSSEYGLTAGDYTQDEAELDQFLDTVEAGVLYANRASGATTGAWPGVQTFCGWKGSGATGKGGLGTWYLPQFMREQSHTIFGSTRPSGVI
jgi:1-pyrroline-5-carboxylate dehydrogenase